MLLRMPEWFACGFSACPSTLHRSVSPLPLATVLPFAFHQKTNGRFFMATINLRDYYPFYQDDVWIEIPDDLAAQLKQWEREESNRQRKRRRYHDYSFSDFQESCMKYECFAPDELYERKLTRQQLHAAISILPDKQAKRIYAHCVLGKSITKIATAEGVSYVAVRSSILRGLRRMGAYLRKENSSFF